jgi:hypothetical protein
MNLQEMFLIASSLILVGITVVMLYGFYRSSKNGKLK